MKFEACQLPIGRNFLWKTIEKFISTKFSLKFGEEDTKQPLVGKMCFKSVKNLEDTAEYLLTVYPEEYYVCL